MVPELVNDHDPHVRLRVCFAIEMLSQTTGDSFVLVCMMSYQGLLILQWSSIVESTVTNMTSHRRELRDLLWLSISMAKHTHSPVDMRVIVIDQLRNNDPCLWKQERAGGLGPWGLLILRGWTSGLTACEACSLLHHLWTYVNPCPSRVNPTRN